MGSDLIPSLIASGKNPMVEHRVPEIPRFNALLEKTGLNNKYQLG
jgi:hypothetical protein